jgi:hypothetical protein
MCKITGQCYDKSEPVTGVLLAQSMLISHKAYTENTANGAGKESQINQGLSVPNSLGHG